MTAPTPETKREKEMTPTFDQLTDEQIRDAEREIANQKRERGYAKWDAELVGRYFRVIRTRERDIIESLFQPPSTLPSDDYVTLEESLAVGSGKEERYVYADVVYVHVQSREDCVLTCSGFQCSHSDRREPYLKIQPVFYSYDDFRKYLGQWNDRTGPTKHVDEISEEEYRKALATAVGNFTKSTATKAKR